MSGALHAEQVGVGAGADEIQNARLLLINQNQIRHDMALAEAMPLARQFMVVVTPGKGDVFRERLNHAPKALHVIPPRP